MSLPRRPPYPAGVPASCRHPFRKREYRCEGCGEPSVWATCPPDSTFVDDEIPVTAQDVVAGPTSPPECTE